ncbi:MAG: DMT family transporter [Gammaproteobacteria bacterium]|jgi:drug/metabolite transporter (DMT)-like permease
MFVYTLIFGRVLASSYYLVFQKRLTQDGAHPMFVIIVSYILFSLIAVPLLFLINLGNISIECWLYLFLTSVLDAVGNIFAIMSLNLTELSIFGPINAFKPIITLFIAMTFLHEIPNIWGTLGIAIIFGGSYVLGLSQNHQKKHLGFLKIIFCKSFYYRIVGMLLFLISNVFAKKAIILSSPLTVIAFWATLGLPFIFIGLVFLKKTVISKNILIFQNNIGGYFKVLICLLVMQVLTMLVFSKLFIAYSLALFQFSSIVSIFLGYKYFKERQIKIKLLGAFIMILGLCCVAIGK